MGVSGTPRRGCHPFDVGRKRMVFVVPANMLVITVLFGINEVVKKAIERGASVRGISYKLC
jgi:hypothetical protein